MSKRLVKYLSLGLKIAVTTILGYIILRTVNFSELVQTIQEARVSILAFTASLWFVSIAVSALRWRIILQTYDIPSAFSELYRLYLSGAFFNNFLPTGFGGDGYKFFVLNGLYPNKKKKLISSMILERGFGFLAMFMIIFLVGVLFIPELISEPILGIIYLLSTGILATLLGLITLYPKIEKSIPESLSKNKVISKGSLLRKALIELHSPKALIELIGLSLIFSLMGSVSFFFMFYAFGTTVPFYVILFLIPVINLSSLFPFSLNSLGIKEGLAVYLFALFDISPEVVIPVFLTNRIFLILLSLSGGITYLLEKGKEKPSD